MFIKCQYSPVFHGVCRAESTSSEILTIQNMNPYIKQMGHPTRNEVSDAANALEKELLVKDAKLPFRKVIRADIFDPQAVNYFYVTYGRQVLALLCLRYLFKNPKIPKDVKIRAGFLKKFLPFGSVGAYGPSNGLYIVRKHVARYLSRRDNVHASIDNIFLCEGISDGFRSFIKMLNCKINGKIPAIMLPIPHHPMYSALIQACGMKVVYYQLNEIANWTVIIERLKEALFTARETCNPRALLILNPDMITGNVFNRNALMEIIKFAKEERLVIIADETYHNNVYKGKFYSVRAVQRKLHHSYRDVELVSMMSCSEGWFGECGMKSGYIELSNFDPNILEMYFKCLRITRKPNILGQIMLDSFVNPPHQKDQSYKQYMKEKMEIISLLKKKSEMAMHELSSVKGFKCNQIQGGIAMCPKVYLPKKAQEKAAEANKLPDVYFALKLLKATGVSIIPGSFLGIPQNDFHICLTILPHIDQLQTMLRRIKSFYETFYKEHKSGLIK